MEIYKQIWHDKYKGISYEICFWTSENMQKPENSDNYKAGGIWNSYVTILKKQIPKHFKKLIGDIKVWNNHISRDYNHLHNIFDFPGGITFYESIFNERGKIIGFKVGNDYSHVWNDGTEDKEQILCDIKEVIDTFINHYPNYKVWSSMDGAYVMPHNLEEHDRIAKLKFDKKYGKEEQSK